MKTKIYTRQNRKSGRAALAFALLLSASTLASVSHASGSFGPSATGSFQNTYNLGKRVYFKKLACDTCPLASDSLDKKQAMMVIEQLNDSKEVMKLLSNKERSAVIHYLKKRHKIS